MRALPLGHAELSNWRWCVSGAVLGGLVALVLFAPARWLAAGVESATRGQVSLPDARGTVWSGSSQLVLSGGKGSQGSTALPQRMDWQLRPSFTGIQVQAFAPCCMAQAMQFATRFGWAGVDVRVQDHSSNWPAGLLVGLGTPWNTIAAEGNLAVASKGLSVEWADGRMVVSGSLQIDALEMASRLTTLKPVGSYRLTLNGGTLVSLKLQTLQGSLQLSGEGQWVGGHLRFEGVASAEPQRQDALSNLLNIIGRREGARSIIRVG